MKLSALLEPLVAAGVDASTILKTVKAWEDQQTDALERRRANDRERQERHRHGKSRDTTVTVSSRASATPGSDNLQTTEIAGNKEERKTSSSNQLIEEQFDAFWAAYPRKVAKADARKLFPQAVKLAGFEAIMAGVHRFAAERAGEEQQYTMHPDKWLRGQHWNDEPTAPREHQPRAGPAPPRVVHGVTAALGRRYQRQEQWDEQPKIGCGDEDAQRIPADERQLRLVAGHVRAAARGPFG